MFERIDFPVDEFFPPERCEFIDSPQDDISVPEDEKKPPHGPGCGCRPTR
ncbi:MAG: hypothetical protein PUF72_07260 [Clostridiales bacterium]|nr:hypothetical protein [Clostridiales bacterium]